MTVNYSPSHANGFTVEGTLTEDKLFDRNTVVRKVMLASGAGVQPRGALLGKVTASSKHLLSLAAAGDGSQVPRVILLHDADATSADVEIMVAISGTFAPQGMTFGAGHTPASVEDALIARNIYLENIVG